MSYPVFTVPDGDVLPIFFATFDGGTGASITMTDLTTADIEIYKDGVATTRTGVSGYTLLDSDGIDFDSRTGIHGISIDTGDDDDTGFYTVGSWFTVIISTITVDSQTVSFVAAMFRIMAAEASAGVVDANIASTDDIDLSATQKASVNTEVVDALQTDTLTATTQGAPPTNPTFMQAQMALYDALVHGVDVTATFKTFKNNAGTVIWKKELSDDGTTYAEAESESGP